MSEPLQSVLGPKNALEVAKYDLDAGIIRCICGVEEDDGFTIQDNEQCERCYVWQHAVCVGIDQLHVPDEYLCDLCFPRPLDVKKAVEKQRRRKEQESTHVSLSSSHPRRRRHLCTAVKSKVNIGGIKKPLSPSMKQENLRKPRTSHRAFAKDAENRFQAMEDVGESNMNVNSYLNCNSEYSTIENNLVTSMGAQTYISMLFQDKSQMQTVPNDYFTLKNLPATSIRSSLNFGFSSMLRFSLYADQSIESSKIIKEFKGEVYLQDEYKDDSINKYSYVLAPMPFVYFISDSKLCVDTRKYGTDSRFIRRSCKPNAKLITVLSDDDSYIHVVLYSLTHIHAGSEITIDWNWDMNHPANILESHEYISEDEIKYSQDLIYFIDGSECACELGKECILFRLKRLFSNISKSNIKPSKKKNASPLNNINYVDNDDLDRSMTRFENGSSVINKSQSATEMSELFTRAVSSSADSPSNGALSAREERKIKDILARIEKLEQEETQVSKKRKQRNEAKSNENHKTYGYRKTLSSALIKQGFQQSVSPPVSVTDSPKEGLPTLKTLSQRPGRVPSRISRMQKHRKIANSILKEYSESVDTNDILPCKKMWIKRWTQENLKIDAEKIMRKDKQKLKNVITELQINIDSGMPKHSETIDPVKHESSPPLDTTLLGQLLPPIESSDKLSLDFTSPEPVIAVAISDPSQLSDKSLTPSLLKSDIGFSSTSESHMSSFTVASPLTSELEPIQSNTLFTSPTSILESFPKRISLSEYRKRKNANEVVAPKEDALSIDHC
ncbi:uncharacterized protein T551_01934 [Pneumocystis jirovecii RU7]|uniref:SET domain-containing protein n=1 Tax=Pneumocystis jirovecii (strain RU7) TaxID=1408657 RepID=A0A0W4ZNR3_PNEJ7|nr:uncharacterized protein T551_01934 [Pneumocystis jirovecii RU7]KTW29990.1 hypothetical protein T551_01934 [Pneumocystis jirovecii RU7]